MKIKIQYDDQDCNVYVDEGIFASLDKHTEMVDVAEIIYDIIALVGLVKHLRSSHRG